jgi:magnesium-transporting ATPase (P-type)
MWDVMKEPMFLLLVVGGVLYLFMGEPKDAAMLLGFVFVVMGITIVQERRTERALDALRDHVETLSQKLSSLKQSVNHNPVRQTGYSSGDVELF